MFNSSSIVALAGNVLRLCVCLPLAQSFNFTTNVDGAMDFGLVSDFLNPFNFCEMKKYIDLEIDWQKYPWASCAAQDRSGAIHVFEVGAKKDLDTKTWIPSYRQHRFDKFA